MAQPLSPAKIQQIKALAKEGHRTKEIARHLGVSDSTVHKVRQGYYDQRLLMVLPAADEEVEERLAVWCPRCRCHIYPPCQMCHLREYERRQAGRGGVRPPAPLPPDLRDPQVLKRLYLSVAEIGLSLRTVNYLQQRNILTVNDLLHCTREELLRIPNFAGKTLEHVYRCLKRLGFARQGEQSSAVQTRRAG